MMKLKMPRTTDEFFLSSWPAVFFQIVAFAAFGVVALLAQRPSPVAAGIAAYVFAWTTFAYGQIVCEGKLGAENRRAMNDALDQRARENACEHDWKKEDGTLGPFWYCTKCGRFQIKKPE